MDLKRYFQPCVNIVRCGKFASACILLVFISFCLCASAKAAEHAPSGGTESQPQPAADPFVLPYAQPSQAEKTSEAIAPSFDRPLAAPLQAPPGAAPDKAPSDVSRPGPVMPQAAKPYEPAEHIPNVFSVPLAVLNPFGKLDETGQFLDFLEPYFFNMTHNPLQVTIKLGRGGADAWGTIEDLAPSGNSAALIIMPNLVLRGLHPYSTYRLGEVCPEFVLAEVPLALWVPENSPYANLRDLIQDAFMHPGALVMGGGGSYSAPHLAALQFCRAAGITAGYAAYMGTEDAMKAAQDGKVKAVWGYALAEPGKTQKMRPLAVAARLRSPALPDLPTFDEQKVDMFASASFGFTLPLGVGEPERVIWHDLFSRMSSDQEFVNAALQSGFYVRFIGRPEIVRWFTEQTDVWREQLSGFGLLR